MDSSKTFSYRSNKTSVIHVMVFLYINILTNTPAWFIIHSETSGFIRIPVDVDDSKSFIKQRRDSSTLIMTWFNIS